MSTNVVYSGRPPLPQHTLVGSCPDRASKINYVISIRCIRTKEGENKLKIYTCSTQHICVW